jgi:tetratricopeptide (TPR) repeat protein
LQKSLSFYTDVTKSKAGKMLRSEKFFLGQCFVCLLILCSLFSFVPQARAGYVEIPEFLCELGLNFYKQGRYDEALMEFKKALMADPDYAPAYKYIQMVEQMKKQGAIRKRRPAYKVGEYGIPDSSLFLEKGQIFDYYDGQRQLIMERQLRAVGGQPLSQMEEPIYPAGLEPFAQELVTPQVFTLDETLLAVKQPLEIEQGKAIVLRGVNIRRFLVTNEDVIAVERLSPDELLITGRDIGFSYLHVWDQRGRWTVELQGIFPRSELPTYEETLLIETERTRNFKLRYTLDWSLFESGSSLDTLQRNTYSWSHGLSLTGGTPYGDIDALVRIRKFQEDADLTYLTFGLTNGRFHQFEGFSLRGADYTLPFANMALGAPVLRGVKFSSPAFNNKFEYTTFWGREGGGRFGNLSPGLAETRHSFLNGFHFNINPYPWQNYKFLLVHGWGRDRAADLTHYAYDFMTSWIFKPWRIEGEVAHDAENIAYLTKTQFNVKRFTLNTAFRDIPVLFNSITGRAWRAGEFGGTVIADYRPTEKLSTSAVIDVYRDRAFPADDNPERYNEDLTWDLFYYQNLDTTYNAGYTFQNYLGTLSQTRGQTLNLGVSRNLGFH